MSSDDCKFTKIPEVSFLVSYGGITVFSERMTNPKLVPFDICGRCRSCKSDSVTVDYAIQNEGVTVMTDRMKKPKFVPFDAVLPFKNECFFRVKTQRSSIDIPFRVETTSDSLDEHPGGAKFTSLNSRNKGGDPTPTTTSLGQQYNVPSDLIADKHPCEHHSVSASESNDQQSTKIEGDEEFTEVVLDTGNVDADVRKDNDDNNNNNNISVNNAL